MSADVIYGYDFKNKKRFTPVETSLETQMKIIARELPPEILLTIYESSLGFVAPKDEPA
jgi:hypothetical protein